jgi:hypothetical protein
MMIELKNNHNKIFVKLVMKKMINRLNVLAKF